MHKKILTSFFFSFLLLATFFVVPVQADKGVGVIITVKGGIGVTIEIENTRPNDTISYNFSIIWWNIFNKVIGITEVNGTVPPYMGYGYGEARFILLGRVYVHVESEGVIVEREGFVILVFVFLKPNIELT